MSTERALVVTMCRFNGMARFDPGFAPPYAMQGPPGMYQVPSYHSEVSHHSIEEHATGCAKAVAPHHPLRQFSTEQPAGYSSLALTAPHH